jgi:LPS-assembly protein
MKSLRSYILLFLLAFPVFGANQPPEKPISNQEQQGDPFQFESDQITYYPQQNEVSGEGNVKILFKKGEKIHKLLAHKVTYNSLTKKVWAEGKVRLFEPDGTILSSDFLELSDDLEEGTIKALTVITEDKTYIAAASMERMREGVTHFNRGAYTPCELCRVGPLPGPLWQIKAEKITHDKKNKTVTYKNARLELKGIPIFYAPYFRHPDPTVKRKSGFLFPSYGNSSSLGMNFKTPYYIDIDQTQDLTINPIYTQKEGMVYGLEYRKRPHNGYFSFEGSYTKAKSISNKASLNQPANGPRNPQKERWHIISNAKIDISDSARFQANINRASDTTYLFRYPIKSQAPTFVQNRNLTSNLTFENFKPNYYWGVRSYAFQTDAPKTTPLVLPWVQFHGFTDPNRLGAYFTFDASFLSLSRIMYQPGRFGTEMQRTSGALAWVFPYVTSGGHIITTTLSARGDTYHSKHYFRESVKKTKTDQVTGRLFPVGSINWRYPLSKSLGQTLWVIEPTVGYTGSPYRLNNKNIPNEDSNIFELDDTNLMVANRFDGLDRVDSGHRIMGGFDQTLYLPNKRLINVFLGQGMRLDNRQVVKPGWGEDQKYTDYIARIKVKPIDWLAVRYRTALYRKNFHPRYSEFGTRWGYEHINLDLGYMFLNRKATFKDQDMSQIMGQLRFKIYEHWSFSLAQIKNLKKNRGGSSLANFASVGYSDECFKMDLGIYKTGYHDRDIRPDSGFLLQFTLKNLGSFAPISGAPSYPGSILNKI